MIIKYAGIILVSGGISMIGYHKAHKIKENIMTRKALYELVLYIKSCIEEASMPLFHIYALFENKHLEKIGFTEILKVGSTSSFKSALNNAQLYIPDSLMKIYLSLAESLGKSRSAKNESELLSRYIKSIEKEEEKLIKDDETKIQLYKKLGVLTGLLAALILV